MPTFTLNDSCLESKSSSYKSHEELPLPPDACSSLASGLCLSFHVHAPTPHICDCRPSPRSHLHLFFPRVKQSLPPLTFTVCGCLSPCWWACFCLRVHISAPCHRRQTRGTDSHLMVPVAFVFWQPRAGLRAVMCGQCPFLSCLSCTCVLLPAGKAHVKGDGSDDAVCGESEENVREGPRRAHGI